MTAPAPAPSRASAAPRGKRPRLAYVDWVRGLAVLIMILWHTSDSWTAASSRQGWGFPIVVFIGGWAAPLFLFLAGVSVPLAGAARVARGATRRAAAWSLQKRGWEIFVLAHVFRLQSFLLNPMASWSSLLKPDILNILGLGLVGAAFCWGRASTLARRVAWLIGPTAVFVLLAPASRVWRWPAVFRAFAPRLEAYIRPVGGMGVFSIFPWVGFVFVGAFVGGMFVASGASSDEAVAPRRLAWAGLAAMLGGGVGMWLPALTASSFWTTSVSFFLLRTGAMTLAMPLAWLWLRGRADRWSPMVVFGRTSLFVYWIHVELAYGFATYPLHGRLSLPWALAAFGLFTVAMLGCAVLWQRRRQPLIPDWLKPPAEPAGGPGGGRPGWLFGAKA